MLQRLDHLVLTVASIERSCRFYAEVLGMQVITFGDDRKALRFGEQKINLHQAGAELQPHAANPVPGSADLCFISAEPLESVQARLQAASVQIEQGPIERSGALGPILSLYIRDPDWNLIEISQYLD